MKWFWLLLIPSICFGAEVASIGGVADSSIASVGGVTGTGIASICGVDYDDGDSACSVASNEVGDRTDYTATSHYNITNTAMYCLEYTADCTGTLEYAFARHYGTASDKAKVCVFNKNSDAPPDASDTLIGCGEITTSSDDWAQSAAKVTGSVTASTAYWVCIVGSNLAFDISRSDSGSRTAYYVSSGANYTTPSLDLSFSSTASRDYSMYVRIE